LVEALIPDSRVALGCEKLGGCLVVERRHATTIAHFGSDAQTNKGTGEIEFIQYIVVD
jgi:hypothetical protein